MSFAEQVKDELARMYPDSETARRGEMTALLRMGGSLTMGPGGAGLHFDTHHNPTARKMWSYVKQLGGIMPRVIVRQGGRLRKKNVYRLVIDPSEAGRRFLAQVGIFPVTEVHDADIFCMREERRAYVCGAFLGGGSVNHPQGDYHLEMVTKSNAFAETLILMLKTFKLTAKIAERKDDYIVYLKDGESIAELLRVMGATSTLLEFENIRIMKEMRNQVNRVVNCETANLQKTIDAAWQQVQDIERIKKYRSLDSLPLRLREAAVLRLEHPDAPLQELVHLLGGKITKSGLYHRYRKLAILAAACEEPTEVNIKMSDMENGHECDGTVGGEDKPNG